MVRGLQEKVFAGDFGLLTKGGEERGKPTKRTRAPKNSQ